MAQRSEKIPELRSGRNAGLAPISPDGRVERVINHLVRIAKARPRKRKTLASNLASFFGKQIGAHEVAAVIAALEEAGKLVIDEKDVVSYRL